MIKHRQDLVDHLAYPHGPHLTLVWGPDALIQIEDSYEEITGAIREQTGLAILALQRSLSDAMWAIGEAAQTP